jgi:hypothetical protein
MHFLFTLLGQWLHSPPADDSAVPDHRRLTNSRSVEAMRQAYQQSCGAAAVGWQLPCSKSPLLLAQAAGPPSHCFCNAVCGAAHRLHHISYFISIKHLSNMLCYVQVKVQQLASSGVLETVLQQLQTSTLSCSLVSPARPASLPISSMSHSV